MLVIDYNNAAISQYEAVNANRKQVNLFFGRIFSFSLSTWLTSFIKKKLVTVNAIQTSDLLYSKGMLVDLEKKQAQLQGQNLSKLIGHIDKLLNQNILFNDVMEKLIKEEDVSNRFEELRSIISVTRESIEVQYDILRFLKKNNKKNPIETSPLASESNGRSLNSLETASYERRTT